MRLRLLLVFFTPLLFASPVFSKESWKELQSKESDLAFLKALAPFALSADTGGFENILLDLEELSEIRRAATVAVILDQWVRKDPENFRNSLESQWEQLDPMVHQNYLRIGLRTDAAHIIGKLFDESDSAAEYRDPLMYEMIRLQPEIVANQLSKNEGKDQNQETRSQWANQLTRSWMEKSPEKAFEWAIKNREMVDLNQLFQSLLYSSDEDAKGKLGELWSMLPKDAQKPELQENVANRLIYSDPELALDFIEGLPEAKRYPLMHRAMGRLAEAKSPKAAELMRSLPQRHLPNLGTMKKVLLEWGLREPDKAAAWADGIEDAEKREEALARINTVFGMLDPQRAIDQALAAPEGTLRRTLIRNTALLLAKEDLEEGLNWLDALPESAGKKLALQSIRHMTDRLPPETLLEGGLKMKPTPSVDNFIDQVFDQWCNTDIEAATNWFLTLPESEQNSRRAHDVGYELATRKPELALNYLFSESTPMGVRQKIYSSYMRRYSHRPEMLQSLLADIKPEHADTLISTSEIGNLGRRAPELALQLADQLSDNDRVRTIMRIANSWVQEDPAALAAYLENNDLDIRYNYARIAENLSARDYENVEAWVESLESPTARSYAYIGLAKHVAKTSPSESLKILNQVEEGNDRGSRHARHGAYEDIIEQWAYFHPEAAQAALDESKLPEKVKKRFSKSIQNVDVDP